MEAEGVRRRIIDLTFLLAEDLLPLCRESVAIFSLATDNPELLALVVVVRGVALQDSNLLVCHVRLLRVQLQFGLD